jgi:hypothetical protein
LTLSGLKTMVPDGTYGYELSRPKRVSWLLAYRMMEATRIPVSCGGVKTHVSMGDEVVNALWASVETRQEPIFMLLF